MYKKILIVTANPKDTARLRLDKEVDEIDKGLSRAKNRDSFMIEQKLAVSVSDLRRALLDHEPHIVHFSGHGEADGLIFENEHAEAIFADPVGIAELFGLFRQHVECVLLNACYSEQQARAINQYINYVIGMGKHIGDVAAIEFTIGFYDALGAGRSYQTAFKFGVNAIQLKGIPEYLTPILFDRQGSFSATLKDDSESSGSDIIPSREEMMNSELYNLLAEKIERLEHAYIIETDPARKFQLEKQIEDSKNDLAKML